MRIFFLKAFLLVFKILLISTIGYSQSDSVETNIGQKLKIGVHAEPPYIIQGDNQTWDGISIQLWREIAESLQLQYQWVSIPAEAQHSALQKGDIDIALLANASAKGDSLMDFSYFYHTSKLGLAMPQSNSLSSIATAFFSKRFWQIVVMLSVLLLIVGTVIYFIERSSNEDNFGGERSIIKGIGAGFWWAGVTMTTIGYGDKAPVTFFGRAVALLWMLIAMGVTSVLTAGLISAMGGSYSKTLDIPEDLRDMKVAAVADSPAASYLQGEGVNFQSYQRLEDALKAVMNEEPEVVVSSVPHLKYMLDNNKNISLKVQPKQLDPQYYALGMREESVLREPLNQTLLQIIKANQWQEVLKRYMPETSSK